jgi:hypothetical protein
MKISNAIPQPDRRIRYRRYIVECWHFCSPFIGGCGAEWNHQMWHRTGPFDRHFALCGDCRLRRQLKVKTEANRG